MRSFYGFDKGNNRLLGSFIVVQLKMETVVRCRYSAFFLFLFCGTAVFRLVMSMATIGCMPLFLMRC